MAKDAPLVSIITPTYNREDFIQKAVDEVLAQSYDNFELLIVDDGSTDNTKVILEPYLRDSRISYFYQENQGQSVARKFALSRAKGDFICFLDSDNYWSRDKLERQLGEFKLHPHVDIVYGDIITIDEAGNEVSRDNMRRYSGHIAPQMMKDNCVSMNTAMAKRRCFDELGGPSGNRRVADDYELWLRFSARYQYLYVPEYYAYYRVMRNQISSDKSRRFDSNESILHDFADQFPDAMSRGEFDKGFAAFYTRKARYLGMIGRKKDAMAEAFRALRYTPFSQVPWRGLVAVLIKRGS